MSELVAQPWQNILYYTLPVFESKYYPNLYHYYVTKPPTETQIT